MEEGRRTRDEKSTSKIRTVRDLKVYRKAFDNAMEIYDLAKNFPKEETYSLTDQIDEHRVPFVRTYQRGGENADTRQSF